MTDAKRFAFARATASSPFVTTTALHAAGLNDYDIRELALNGTMAREARGVYRVKGAPDGGGGGSELALLFSLVPGAVLCLESALAWHELTTSIPRGHCLALRRESHAPGSLRCLPVKVYYFSACRHSLGIEAVSIEGVPARVYDIEKTICDVVFYRNRVGEGIVMEALREYVGTRSRNVQRLMEYAAELRMRTSLARYLEVLL